MVRHLETWRAWAGGQPARYFPPRGYTSGGGRLRQLGRYLKSGQVHAGDCPATYPFWVFCLKSGPRTSSIHRGRSKGHIVPEVIHATIPSLPCLTFAFRTTCPPFSVPFLRHSKVVLRFLSRSPHQQLTALSLFTNANGQSVNSVFPFVVANLPPNPKPPKRQG